MSAIRPLAILSVLLLVCPAQADPPVLSEMVRAWPWGNRFTLEGDLNGVYVIEASTNLVEWEAIATNAYPEAKREIFTDTDPLWRPKQFFRTWRLREPIFRHALACFQSIRFDHEGGEVDSFDSASPAYSTDGRYEVSKRKDGGNVAVNSELFRSLDIENAKIMGRVQAEGLNLGPNASVGSRAWVEAGNTGVEPGWATDDHEVHTYLVVPPFTNAPPPPAGIVDGAEYTYLLGTGNYLLPSLDFAGDSKMRVAGDAVLYVKENLTMVTAGVIEVVPGASLKLYVGGDNINIIGHRILNGTGNATNFQLYALNSMSSISLTSSSSSNPTDSLIGTIYAPNALFYINCIQSPFHFVGALVGKTARIVGPFKLHFDENLLTTLQR